MVGLDPKEYAKLLMSIGVQQHKKKRALSPLDVAKDIEVLLNDDNMNYNSVSRRIKLSTKQINEFLKLLKIPKTAQDLIGWGNDTGQLDFSTAAKIANIKDSEEMDKLAKAIVSYNLKKQEAHDIVKLVEKDILFEDAVQRVVNFRPKIEKGYAVVINLSPESARILISTARKNSVNPQDLLRDILERYIDHQGLKSVVLKGNFVILTMTEETYSILQRLPEKLGVEKKDLLNSLISTQFD